MTPICFDLMPDSCSAFKEVSRSTEGLKGVHVSKINILELNRAHFRYAIDTLDS